MKKTIIAASLVMTFALALPQATFAATNANGTNNTKASAEKTNGTRIISEADCAHYSITRKQQQLAKLETELEKVKRRSPRRQYTAGIESHMNMLRYELLELQRLVQLR